MVNAFAYGLPEMNFPFQYKTVLEWGSVLTDNRFNMVGTILVGFKRTEDWIGTCYALFIADRPEG